MSVDRCEAATDRREPGRIGLRHRLGALLLGVLALASAGAAMAKIAGGVHCYRQVCLRVYSVEETRSLIGVTRLLEASAYDDPSVDAYNANEFTSDGERFSGASPYRIASSDLPDGTLVLLRNPENGRTSHVRVNDFGPFYSSRRIDATRRVARDLGFWRQGTAMLEVTVLAEPKPEDLVYKRGRKARGARGFIGVVAAEDVRELIERLVEPRPAAAVQVAAVAAPHDAGPRARARPVEPTAPGAAVEAAAARPDRAPAEPATRGETSPAAAGAVATAAIVAAEGQAIAAAEPGAGAAQAAGPPAEAQGMTGTVSAPGMPATGGPESEPDRALIAAAEAAASPQQPADAAPVPAAPAQPDAAEPVPVQIAAAEASAPPQLPGAPAPIPAAAPAQPDAGDAGVVAAASLPPSGGQSVARADAGPAAAAVRIAAAPRQDATGELSLASTVLSARASLPGAMSERLLLALAAAIMSTLLLWAALVPRSEPRVRQAGMAFDARTAGRSARNRSDPQPLVEVDGAAATAPLEACASVVGPDIAIEGRIAARGALWVAGRASGRIEAAALHVEPDGIVDAEVVAGGVVVIAGRLIGTVRAHRVEVLAGAHVDADILADELIVSTEAQFNGGVRCGARALAAAA